MPLEMLSGLGLRFELPDQPAELLRWLHIAKRRFHVAPADVFHQRLDIPT